MDKSLTNAELRAAATSLRLKPSDITLITAPLGTERKVNEQRGYTVDQRQLAELREALRKDTMADYVKKYPAG